jgi:hypothetical protein
VIYLLGRHVLGNSAKGGTWHVARVDMVFSIGVCLVFVSALATCIYHYVCYGGQLQRYLQSSLGEYVYHSLTYDKRNRNRKNLQILQLVIPVTPFVMQLGVFVEKKGELHTVSLRTHASGPDSIRLHPAGMKPPPCLRASKPILLPSPLP